MTAALAKKCFLRKYVLCELNISEMFTVSLLVSAKKVLSEVKDNVVYTKNNAASFTSSDSYHTELLPTNYISEVLLKLILQQLKSWVKNHDLNSQT